MNLKEFCASTGLSDKTVRNWIKDGWLRPAEVQTRYGKAFEFAEADAEHAREVAAAVKAGKIRRNRDHRSAVVANEWERERDAGGKIAAQAAKMLAKGERPAVVLQRMLDNGRDIRRMTWSLLIDVYKLAYGTSNPEELAEKHAVLPQTIDRQRRKVVAVARELVPVRRRR